MARIKIPSITDAFSTIILVLVLALPNSAAAETEAFTYDLRPGDVLSLSLLTQPRSDYLVPVETDGTAWFPMIGSVEVSGRSLSELRVHVSEQFAAASLSLDTGNPRQLLRPHQVFLQIDTYQPIYVSGDIVKPRVLDFRPGMTLKQVMTLAGVNDAGDTTEFAIREKEQARILELTQIQARIWSTQKLLGLPTTFGPDVSIGTMEPRGQEMMEIERRRVETVVAERERTTASVMAAIDQAGRRLAVLQAQHESELEAKAFDDEIMTSLRELNERGLTSAARMADVRRAALASATRVLQLEAAIENALSDLAQLEIQAKSLEFEGQNELWMELRTLIVDYYENKAELEALRAASRIEPLDTSIVATITRQGEADPISFLVSEASLTMRPGDVVEISTTNATSLGDALSLSAN